MLLGMEISIQMGGIIEVCNPLLTLLVGFAKAYPSFFLAELGARMP